MLKYQDINRSNISMPNATEKNNITELHIFCVWDYFSLEKSTQKEVDSIIDGIGRYKKYPALWNKSEAKLNLARIYKSPIPDTQKLNLIVNKKFLIFVVEDQEPKYSFQETTTCIKKVNINMLRAKNKIRRLTGKRFGAHGTDCWEESRRCFWLLFATDNDVRISKFSPRQELFDPESKIHRWTIGYNGWNNHNDLYKTLSTCDDSIIINRRGAYIAFGNEREAISRTCDIDLLSKNRDLSRLIISAEIKPNSNKKHEFIILLNGTTQRVDIRDWRDNYFCPALAAKAISHKSISILAAPICSDMETTRSLMLYNLVVNKKMSAFREYAQLINKLSEIANCKKISSSHDAQIELSRLMRRESFWIPEVNKAGHQDDNKGQYKITREEITLIREFLRESSISILDIPRSLVGVELRYQKRSTNYFDSKIYKIRPGVINNKVPLCLKIVNDQQNLLYSNHYRRNKHKILFEFQSSYTPDFVDYLEARDCFAVLTTWLKGESLEFKLRERKIIKTEAISIAAHSLNFLKALSSQGWVHGDIWERNILIYNDCPYFTDFCNSTKLSDKTSMSFLSSADFKGLFADDSKSIVRLMKLLQIDSL